MLKEIIKKRIDAITLIASRLKRWLASALLPQYTRWQIIDTIYFDATAYCIQTRTNKRNGRVYFKKITIASWIHGHDYISKFSKERLLEVQRAG